jgi:hypothetical protein
VDEDGELRLADQQLPTISRVRGVGSDGAPTDSHEPAKTEVRRELMTRPPEIPVAAITANTQPESYDPPTEELTLPSASSPLLTHNETVLPPSVGVPAGPSPFGKPVAPPEPVFPPTPVAPPFPPAPVFTPPPLPSLPTPAALPPMPPAPLSMPPAPVAPETLADLERSVDSPHLHANDSRDSEPAVAPAPTVTEDSARDAVAAAYSGSAPTTGSLDPITALNAQPLGGALHSSEPAAAPASMSMPQPAQVPYVPPANLFSPNPAPAVPAPVNAGFSEPTPGNSPADETLDMPVPAMPFDQPIVTPTMPQAGQSQPVGSGLTPPPPVPPPMVPPIR